MIQTNENRRREREPFLYYYVWRCVESTEVRGSGGGSRAEEYGKEPRARLPACGHANLRRAKTPIDSQHRPQAKCENCGRRQRLHEGLTQHNDLNHWEYFNHAMGEERRPQGMVWTRNPKAQSRSRTGAPDIPARKAWAEQRKSDLNEALLSIRSNTIEQERESLEHPAESFEQGGEILE